MNEDSIVRPASAKLDLACHLAMVHLGFMELPLSGPFNFAIASGGMLMGIVVSILCYQLSELTGPALPLGGAEALKARGFLGFGDDGGDVLTIEAAVDGFAKACRVPMLATVSWSVVYYNMLGTSVNGMCAVHIFKMIPPDKVADSSRIRRRRRAPSLPPLTERAR